LAMGHLSRDWQPPTCQATDWCGCFLSGNAGARLSVPPGARKRQIANLETQLVPISRLDEEAAGEVVGRGLGQRP
jgi:hypothetical protein